MTISERITALAQAIGAALRATNQQVVLKAAIDSPVLTGIPQAPTAAVGVASTQIATTAYADRAASTGDLRPNFGIYRPEQYGATGDTRAIPGASISSGSTALTFTTNRLTAADVGKTVVVSGAGSGGAALIAKIQSQSGNGAVLSAQASTSVASANGFAWVGTECSAQMQAWLNAIPWGGRGWLTPGASYLITTGLTCSAGNVELFAGGGEGQHVTVGAASTKLVVAGAGVVGLTLGVSSTQMFTGAKLRDFHVIGADSASAGGILFLRQNNFVAEDCSATGFGGGFGIRSYGAAGVNQYGQLVNPSCNNNLIGIDNENSNGLRIFGGMLDGNGNSGNPPGAGTTGIRVVNGDNVKVFGAVIQFYDIGTDVQNGQSHELFGVRHEGCTTGVAISRTGQATQNFTMFGGMVNNYISGGTGIGVQIGAQASNPVIEYPFLTAVTTKVNNNSTTAILKYDTSESLQNVLFANGATFGNQGYGSLLYLGGDKSIAISRALARMLYVGKNQTGDDRGSVIAAGYASQIQTASSAYSLSYADGTVLCNGTFTATLPNPGDGNHVYRGREFTIRNTGLGTITVVVATRASAGLPAGTEALIEGTTSMTVPPGKGVTVQTDATNWYSKHAPSGFSGSAQTVAGPALPTLPIGTEYVWFKTDGAGTLLDIASGVA